MRCGGGGRGTVDRKIVRRVPLLRKRAGWRMMMFGEEVTYGDARSAYADQGSGEGACRLIRSDATLARPHPTWRAGAVRRHQSRTPVLRHRPPFRWLLEPLLETPL